MRNFGRAAVGTYLLLSSCSNAPPATSTIQFEWIGAGNLVQRERQPDRITLTHITAGKNACEIDIKSIPIEAGPVLATKKYLSSSSVFITDDTNNETRAHGELRPLGQDKWSWNGVPTATKDLTSNLMYDFLITKKTCNDVSRGVLPYLDPDLQELRENAARAFQQSYPVLGAT